MPKFGDILGNFFSCLVVCRFCFIIFLMTASSNLFARGTGSTGSTGPTGPTGPIGPTGSVGQTGSTGPTGPSSITSYSVSGYVSCCGNTTDYADYAVTVPLNACGVINAYDEAGGNAIGYWSTSSTYGSSTKVVCVTSNNGMSIEPSDGNASGYIYIENKSINNSSSFTTPINYTLSYTLQP